MGDCNTSIASSLRIAESSAGRETKGDTTTLEDQGVLAKLRADSDGE